MVKNIILFLGIIITFFSSCKTSSVNNGFWFQKRKYNSGWHFKKQNKFIAFDENVSNSKNNDTILLTKDESNSIKVTNNQNENLDSAQTQDLSNLPSIKLSSKEPVLKNIYQSSNSIEVNKIEKFTHSKNQKSKKAPPQWLMDVFSQNGNAEVIISLLFCFVIGCGFLIDRLWKKKKGWAYLLAGLIIGILAGIYLVGGAWAPQFYALFFALTAIIGIFSNNGNLKFWEHLLLILFILALAAFYLWIYTAFYNAFWVAILVQVGLFAIIALVALITSK